MSKKILIPILLIVLMFSSVVNAQSQNDMQYDAGQKLLALGILQGYDDGSLKLDRTITRAEFTTMAIRLICKDDNLDDYKKDTIFNDTTKNHWASPYINIAVEEGLIEGYSDGSFKPDNTISYGEVLTMIVRMLGYEESIDKQKEWPINYVEKAVELKLNQNIKIPINANASRGDVAIFTYNSLLTELKKEY